MTINRVLNKQKLQHFGETLKFSLYVITHPFDGFWDLTHEKRGSIGAANVIVFCLMLVNILRITTTNFQFMTANMEYFNALYTALSVLLPILLWCVANWSLTTLLDGKGKLKEIYMATAYAFTPSVIMNAGLILLSQIITYEEGVIYYYLEGFASIWSYFLVLAAMSMIHSYTFSKAVVSSILTIVGMGVIVFIFVMFFSLISDGVAYFVSIYKEIKFRMY